MTRLLELKDSLIRFYSKNETYVLPGVKFVLALILFLAINQNLGFMQLISTVPVALLLALVCCLLPANYTLLFGAVVILLDMYQLSMEVFVVTAILFVILYLLYFRFTTKDGMVAVAVPTCFVCRIPFLMPIAIGLLRKPYSILTMVCTTVVYYYLNGISQNRAVLEMVVTEDSNGGTTSKFSIAIGQITGNKEMFLVLGVFVLTALVVYGIRRSSMEYAWTVAIFVGVLIELGGLFTGYLVMKISDKTIMLIFGVIISLLLSFLIEFFCMNLDYERTERVQFEDDEYYYYIKAVPKKMVASKEKTVKHFGDTASLGKRIDKSPSNLSDEVEDLSRRVIAKELDIDEDWLK